MNFTLFFFVFTCWGSFQQANAQRFTHPSIPFSTSDLNQLKANIGQEPWLSAYNAFRNDNRSKLTYAMQGPFVTVSRAPNLYNNQWQSDMIAVHNLAFMWVFTSDSAYARKATDILDAWAVTNTVWGGVESMLDIGDYAPYWATGADILRGTFPGWTAANTAHVKSYFENVLWPTSYVPGPLKDHNKGAIQLQIALSVAAFLDDKVKWDQAVEVYRIDAGGGLRNSLPNGEVGDAGRDDHWFGQANALAWGAEVAWKQGVDLYAELDNRLLAIGELYDRYALEGEGMQFIPFGGYSTYYTNWGIPPGYGLARKNFFHNIIENAYVRRKGIPTPFVTQFRAVAGENASSFLFLKSADTSTAAALPPIVYPTTEAATHLTSIDIGNTGVMGSASFNNGVWTLNGAGNSAANLVNYAFKPVSGDCGIVAKMNSNSIGSANSGLMIRESLSASSNFVSVNLNGAGGMNSTARGNTASTNGSHYQPKAPWWLKMERVGNRVFTFHSVDGIHWTNPSLFIMNLPGDVYIGLYTISNNTSALNTATFTNVAITNSSPVGAPVISSPTLAEAILNTAFNYQVVASNSATAYTATALPAGLGIDATSGIISGAPDSLGTFAVTVGATNANGTSTAVLVVKVSSDVAPAIPAALTATVVNTSNIRLNWTASANATGYAVKRSLTAGGPYTLIATSVTGITYTDAAPAPEVNNYYVVTALAGSLESGLSNEVFKSVPPSIPGKPAIALQANSLELSWPAAAGAGSYNVKRGAVMGGPYITIATVATTSFTDVDVTAGNPYYYVVASVGNTQQSGNSLETFGVPGASNVTWHPNPASGNWNQAANWLEGYVPANPAIVTFKASADSVLTNNINGLQASRMVFDTTAVAYTIDGNSVAFANDLINQSSSPQTLNLPVTLTGQLNVNTLAQDITMNGLISGTGSLQKMGSRILYITGNNTYSGNTIIGGAAGGWPPGNAIAIAGLGTGTPSSPISGPLGTGKIIMNGGALYAERGDATLYNDIEIAAGKSSYFFQTTNALNIRGKLMGSGTIRQDGNTFAGLHLYGDNSGFTGTFICVLRSGNNRLRFEVPESGSANAFWNLDATGVDCQSLQFASGTIHFGALTGRGYFRNNGGGAPVMSIGALNMSTNFGGTINGTIGIEKVGSGNLNFTGNHTYNSPTIVRNGKFLLNNNSATGTFRSAVTVVGGAFGGIGLTTAAITIGSGAGSGAVLEPGNLAIGTLTTTGMLTLQPDATYAFELNSTANTADLLKAGGVAINNATLQLTDLASGAFPLGSAITLVENTGSAAVSGIFSGLPELSLVNISGFAFRITYKGGTGNDIVLLDNRTISMSITSPSAAKGLVEKPFNYSIEAINSPTSYSAEGLPSGLVIDTATGIISGTPTVTGTFTVVIAAANASGGATATVSLSIFSNNNISGLFVGNGDAKNVLVWEENAAADTFYIKRSTVSGGPYTLVGKSVANRFTDASVDNEGTYYYTVSAITGIIAGGNSDEMVGRPKFGQVAYYNFDETAGTKALEYWGANQGALMPGASRVVGKIGQGLRFNGTANSYATLPAGIVSALSDFTIGLWVNVASFSSWARVFDFGNAGTTKFMYLCPRTPTAGKVRYGIRNGAAEQSLDANYTFVANTWTHVTITYAANTTKIYINGNLVGSSTNITIKPSDLGITANNNFGKATGTDPMLNGSIDDFRIYNRVLSEVEIAVLASGKMEQTISFGNLPAKVVGDTAFSANASSSSALPVTYFSADTTVATVAGNIIHIVGAGTTTITAVQNGDGSYLAANPVSQVLVVAKQTQTISFSLIPTQRLGDSDVIPDAVAFSLLPLTFTSSDTTVAIIVNGIIKLLAPGTTMVTAYQVGNAIYDTASASQLLVIHALQLYVQSADGDNGNTTNNQIKPNLQVVSGETIDIPYRELAIRYWFTAENFSGINTWVDYAQMGNSNVKMTYTPLILPTTGAFGYVEYNFDSAAGNLTAGGVSGPIQSRLANADWAVLNEADDYSYKTGTGYTPNSKITLYRNGVLVWGTEPEVADSVILVKAYTESKATASNTISTWLRLSNEGNIPVDYNDISVRYWFTKDGTASLNYWTDYAKLGPANILKQFVPVSNALNNADIYLELKINPALGKLYPLSSTGNIQYRIAKSDWSAFSQTNDYSYLLPAAMSQNTKVTVYYKGQIVYGTEPGIAAPPLMAGIAAQEMKMGEEPDQTKIYPNPVSDILTIVLGKLEAPSLFQLYNAEGKQVLSKVLPNTSNSLNVKALAAGAYYYQLKNGNNIISGKLIKQ